MPAVTSRKGLVAALAAAALLPLAAVLPAAHAAPAVPAGQPARTTSGVATVANRPPFDHTSSREARRVDRVPTPKLGWYPCYGNAECATTRLPLDYDHPHGAKTLVAVLRVKAKDQKHKIGSLFVNPGGPGGSGTGLAAGRAVLPRGRGARPVRRRRHRPPRHQLQRPGRLLHGQRGAGQGRSPVSTSPSPTPRRRSGPPSPPRVPSARAARTTAGRSRPRCPPPRWPVTWT